MTYLNPRINLSPTLVPKESYEKLARGLVKMSTNWLDKAKCNMVMTLEDLVLYVEIFLLDMLHSLMKCRAGRNNDGRLVATIHRKMCLRDNT